MSYASSVQFLYSLGNEFKVGAKWDLQRMRALLEALGNPEAGGRFVHVAGTNGKGSTCAMLASILGASGLRTGLYTSPHLEKPTERIQVDGREVSEDEFSAAFNQVHEAAERLAAKESSEGYPSYFELVTGMAFLVFSEKTDISVIEVGLGGRLDATNVISPELTVITPVSFDHEAFLGNTLDAIASEKAGILKPGVPLVLARQVPEAEAVITRVAAELAVPVHHTRDLPVSGIKLTPYGCEFEADGLPVRHSLPGQHQIENAAAAIVASRLLEVEGPAIQKGLADARWPGRLELISRNPDFVLDGAHNPAGARALARYIREFRADRPVWIIYGTMRDKAIDEVTAELFPLADCLILTAPEFPRALRPEVIAALTEHPNRLIAANLDEAIKIANTAPTDAVVFFTGSLFIVGEARAKLLRSKQGHVEMKFQ
ncbi:MAG: bifunctional folylpolyglutamate synthase/dihydrofolate synthase [Bryobacteraceae bacterium]